MTASLAMPEFEELVNHYYQPLYHFAFSLTHDQAAACDLTQQTFYIWARKGHQLREPGKVKTWLFTTLRREFLSARRHAQRFPHVSTDEPSLNLPAVTSDAARELDGQQALDLLNSLEETFRLPLMLFYLEDCSYREIAAILDIPIGTVQSRIARGKSQLQERLGDDD